MLFFAFIKFVFYNIENNIENRNLSDIRTKPIENKIKCDYIK